MKKKIFMLCASAYTAFDYLLAGAYIGKTYKWGYFPRTLQYRIDELLENKQKNSILWVGRLIGLKHPELVLDVAERLKTAGVSFDMSIIGSGDMDKEITEIIDKKNLSDCVHMKGNMTPDEVRNHMERAAIFLFTSDYREGWGAVLNESMNSGCAVVASHAIGSVPFLLKDGNNGLIYRNGNTEELYHHVKYLLEHADECARMGMEAYQTISQQWNAEEAADRVLMLAEELQTGGTGKYYTDGPCSPAKPISNWWYKSGKENP